MTLIEARNISFSYGSGPKTISRVSLSIASQSITAIIGSNGCGKSTLIRLLAGLLAPEHGEVRYRGRPLAEIDRKEFARMLAYVPQNVSRSFPFTALEVVLTGRTPHAAPFRLENEEDERIAREALQLVEMAHLTNRHITELSGGERQLVSVARALAQQPECLLLDEPSSSLDMKHRARLIRVLSDLRTRSGMTVLMVTHDLTLIEPAFDHIFAIRDGELFASGAPSEILRDDVLAAVYDDPYIRARRAEGKLCVWSEVSH